LLNFSVQSLLCPSGVLSSGRIFVRQVLALATANYAEDLILLNSWKPLRFGREIHSNLHNDVINTSQFELNSFSLDTTRGSVPRRATLKGTLASQIGFNSSGGV
jgi:hypothetical protein